MTLALDLVLCNNPDAMPLIVSNGRTLSPLVCEVCLNDSFGFDCSLSCEDCTNGGWCNELRNGCDCPDGWTAIVCNESEFL